MKKISGIIILLLVCANVMFAAHLRHFNINIESVIPEAQVVEHFSEWFNFPNNTTFIQSKAQTDNNGYTHYCYNQYVCGVPVEGGQILVHARNGIVQDINGIVLETEKESSPVTNRIAQKPSITNVTKDVFIIPIKNETDFRYAYKIVSEDLDAYVYIDAENGDTLKINPYIYDVQAKVTTNTIYSGRQQLTVEKSGSQCTYSVTSPRITTINSTNVDFSANTVDMFNAQIQNSIPYKETLADSLSSYLVSIRFDKTNFTWQGSLEYPDLYITIHNSANTLVYKSIVWDECAADYLTFNPLLKLDGDTYTIRIYDQDPVSDDLGGGFKISSQTKGIGTLSLDNFDVTVNVTGNPIRDVHWGMEKTLAFYKDVLNRNSYDGNGATVYQFVNPFMPQKLPNQAFAGQETPFCMVYGLGDGVIYRPFVALDVMAHEFTHMVTAHNIVGGLDYNGESGALNEGFSDIFGVLVEGYTFGQYDWTIGEKITLQHPYLRSLKNPKSGKESQPTTYGKGTWINPNLSDDYGGVHRNSSILSHMFYLLCQGGSGINDNQQSFDVKGIGIEKATKITYNTWMNRLQFESTFADARESFIKEVIALYGKDSQEHQSVVNAWYAVGVGDKYVAEDTEPKQITCTQAVQIAKDLAHNTPTSETYTVIGYVTDTDGKLSKGQQIFWMADTKNGGKVFESYWGNVPEIVHVSDKVSVTGNLMRYNSTSEIKNGNVVIIEHAPQTLEKITNDSIDKCEIEKIFRNGQILIMRGDKIYTIEGQKVK